MSKRLATNPAEHEGIFRWIGHAKRGGNWVVPARVRAVAWMGGIELDLTQARIPESGVEFELVAVMGKILVKRIGRQVAPRR